MRILLRHKTLKLRRLGVLLQAGKKPDLVDPEVPL